MNIPKNLENKALFWIAFKEGMEQNGLAQVFDSINLQQENDITTLFQESLNGIATDDEILNIAENVQVAFQSIQTYKELNQKLGSITKESELNPDDYAKIASAAENLQTRCNQLREITMQLKSRVDQNSIDANHGLTKLAKISEKVACFNIFWPGQLMKHSYEQAVTISTSMLDEKNAIALKYANYAPDYQITMRVQYDHLFSENQNAIKKVNELKETEDSFARENKEEIEKFEEKLKDAQEKYKEAEEWLKAHPLTEEEYQKLLQTGKAYDEIIKKAKLLKYEDKTIENPYKELKEFEEDFVDPNGRSPFYRISSLEEMYEKDLLKVEAQIPEAKKAVQDAEGILKQHQADLEKIKKEEEVKFKSIDKNYAERLQKIQNNIKLANDAMDEASAEMATLSRRGEEDTDSYKRWENAYYQAEDSSNRSRNRLETVKAQRDDAKEKAHNRSIDRKQRTFDEQLKVVNNKKAEVERLDNKKKELQSSISYQQESRLRDINLYLQKYGYPVTLKKAPKGKTIDTCLKFVQQKINEKIEKLKKEPGFDEDMYRNPEAFIQKKQEECSNLHIIDHMNYRVSLKNNPSWIKTYSEKVKELKNLASVTSETQNNLDKLKNEVARSALLLGNAEKKIETYNQMIDDLKPFREKYEKNQPILYGIAGLAFKPYEGYKKQFQDMLNHIDDQKRFFHLNSSSFTDMKNALTSLVNDPDLEVKNPSETQLQNIQLKLNRLSEKTKAYIVAKGLQERKSPSAMRTSRLNAARDLQTLTNWASSYSKNLIDQKNNYHIDLKMNERLFDNKNGLLKDRIDAILKKDPETQQYLHYNEKITLKEGYEDRKKALEQVDNQKVQPGKVKEDLPEGTIEIDTSIKNNQQAL